MVQTLIDPRMLRREGRDANDVCLARRFAPFSKEQAEATYVRIDHSGVLDLLRHLKTPQGHPIFLPLSWLVVREWLPLARGRAQANCFSMLVKCDSSYFWHRFL